MSDRTKAGAIRQSYDDVYTATQFITDAHRICLEHPACVGCPLVNDRCNVFGGVDVDTVEIVRKWAETHRGGEHDRH